MRNVSYLYNIDYKVNYNLILKSLLYSILNRIRPFVDRYSNLSKRCVCCVEIGTIICHHVRLIFLTEIILR